MSGRNLLLIAIASLVAGFVLMVIFVQYGRADMGLLGDLVRYCF